MERRGMTLIEVLAVVAILAVLGALALPAVESRIDSARFDAAGREVEAAVVMARAEAQRRGAVVSLVARGMGNGETGLFEEVMSDRAARRESLDNGTSGTGATATESDSAHGDGSAPVVVLESGVRVTATLDTGSEGTGDLAVKGARGGTGGLQRGGLRARKGNDGGSGNADVAMARFMPDGSAVASGPVYVVVKSMAAAVRVNRWTGSASLEMVEAEQRDGGGATEVGEQKADGDSAATGRDSRMGDRGSKRDPRGAPLEVPGVSGERGASGGTGASGATGAGVRR